MTQNELTDMLANGRAAMYFLERELRLAGSDPTEKADAGFIAASADSIHFTMDVTGGQWDNDDNDYDGQKDANDPDEKRFADGDINTAAHAEDNDEDIRYGINTSGGLGRAVNGDAALQTVVENIEVIDFVYRDRSGNTLPRTVPAAQLDDIRSIDVTIIAASAHDDVKLMARKLDSTTYRNGQNDVILSAPNDYRRRVQLSSRIYCRNLGF